MAWKHGFNGYHNYGCRCDVCREGARVYMMAYRRRRGVRPLAEFHARGSRQAHGTEGRYTYGCRCDDCRNASNAARRARNAKDPEVARARWREQRRKRRLKVKAT